MILLLSLSLDVLLMIILVVRRRNGLVLLKTLAMSALINVYAHYMIAGLSDSFGKNSLFAWVCTITAKIFVIWIVMQPGEPEKKNVPVYGMTILLSLCLHENPVFGMVSQTIFLLFLLYQENQKAMPETETQVPSHKRESDLYLRTIEDSYRKNRALMHDLKNYIIAIRSLAEKQEYDKLLEYTDSMAEKVSENLFPVHSGNIVLDALLADKYHTARRNGIYTEFQSVRYHADLDNQDLCTVIGNLFDNAIAENLKTSRMEERWISVSIRTTEEGLMVELSNPLFHELKVQQGLPVSDKPNLEHHGIGLKNVRRVCEAYGGVLIWDDADGKFMVTVTLPGIVGQK